MPRVMTTCPATGHPVATHAVMTAARFKRLKTDLAFYCAECHQPHLGERCRLWLEGAIEPVVEVAEPVVEVAPRQTQSRSGLAAERVTDMTGR
jgi:hypothetical protein